jgi:hypothetical protein
MKGRGFDRRHFSCNFNAVIHRRPGLSRFVGAGTPRQPRWERSAWTGSGPARHFAFVVESTDDLGMHCAALAMVLHPESEIECRAAGKG